MSDTLLRRVQEQCSIMNTLVKQQRDEAHSASLPHITPSIGVNDVIEPGNSSLFPSRIANCQVVIDCSVCLLIRGWGYTNN